MTSEDNIQKARTLIRDILVENEDTDNQEWFIRLSKVYGELGKIYELM